MKLLFDENLSPALVHALAHDYPASSHVRFEGMLGAEDGSVWTHARGEGFVIVSKDTDFRERSLVEGFPPKIVWLDVRNAGTEPILELLRRERERLERFVADGEGSLLILSMEGNSI